MTATTSTTQAGFHEGELAVQRSAGVEAQAARLSPLLDPPALSPGFNQFLATRTFAALTARDRTGTLWISPLTGPPGFIEATTPTTLAVHGRPSPGDPLEHVQPDQQAALIVIDFAARRRIRINGTLSHTDSGTLRISVDQAYGNCPQYIQQRHMDPQPAGSARHMPTRHDGPLTSAEAELVHRADTFLIGTTHPTRGNDASHRGGPPGFVRVEGDRLWWPDYQGNNMFNTMGNLAVDPTAALLFFDFTTGETLHLSGSATVDFTPQDIPGDDGGTGRRLHFIPRHVVAGHLLPMRASTVAPYPGNPDLTDEPQPR
ncbi:pyridoxamine 5'-phosphate oxidase family protein [Streptomyces sp. Tue6028]|uniref:pyridoxamine 5'-phosphate oxidase family protein n=1 Tax=Streptomyces sp. Tue6028 TaxID=2036037 RepID=UPI003EBC14C5